MRASVEAHVEARTKASVEARTDDLVAASSEDPVEAPVGFPINDPVESPGKALSQRHPSRESFATEIFIISKSDSESAKQ